MLAETYDEMEKYLAVVESRSVSALCIINQSGLAASRRCSENDIFSTEDA